MIFTVETGKTSSNVLAAHYDVPTRILTITFQGGAEYEYQTPPGRALFLAEAESAGKYLNQCIKKLDPYRLKGTSFWKDPEDGKRGGGVVDKKEDTATP
jgi:hypothetical protein